jgi:hypothetical protein
MSELRVDEQHDHLRMRDLAVIGNEKMGVHPHAPMSRVAGESMANREEIPADLQLESGLEKRARRAPLAAHEPSRVRTGARWQPCRARSGRFAAARASPFVLALTSSVHVTRTPFVSSISGGAHSPFRSIVTSSVSSFPSASWRTQSQASRWVDIVTPFLVVWIRLSALVCTIPAEIVSRATGTGGSTPPGAIVESPASETILSCGFIHVAVRFPLGRAASPGHRPAVLNSVLSVEGA